MSAHLIGPNIDRAHAAARSFSALSSLGERWADVTQVNSDHMQCYLQLIYFAFLVFLAWQACMRPLTPDGYPVMGAINNRGCDGVFISAG